MQRAGATLNDTRTLVSTRHHKLTQLTNAILTTTMNALVNRFSSTSEESQLQRAREEFGDEELADSAWGSEAGFGMLSKGGVPTFGLPRVLDVSGSIPPRTVCFGCGEALTVFCLRAFGTSNVIAYGVLKTTHGRPC